MSGGGIIFREPDELEVIVVGELDGLEVIILGTGGGPEVVETTRRLVELFKGEDLLVEGAEVLVVDVATHSIRPARLERISSSSSEGR